MTSFPVCDAIRQYKLPFCNYAKNKNGCDFKLTVGNIKQKFQLTTVRKLRSLDRLMASLPVQYAI